MSHDSHAGDPDCTTSGSPGETTHDCGRGCQLHAAGRCSFGVVPGASNTALTAQVKRLDASWLGDLLARVPEPPLFDFLRPPN